MNLWLRAAVAVLYRSSALIGLVNRPRGKLWQEKKRDSVRKTLSQLNESSGIYFPIVLFLRLSMLGHRTSAVNSIRFLLPSNKNVFGFKMVYADITQGLNWLVVKDADIPSLVKNDWHSCKTHRNLQVLECVLNLVELREDKWTLVVNSQIDWRSESWLSVSNILSPFDVSELVGVFKKTLICPKQMAILVDWTSKGVSKSKIQSLLRWSAQDTSVRRAIILSTHGKYMFGGVEHFAAELRNAYLELGFDSSETLGVSTIALKGNPQKLRNGISSTELRDFLIENQISILHVFPGCFELALSAAENLPTRIILGVHFWRELFSDLSPHRKGHTDFVLRAFEKAAVVYSNSKFSQESLDTLYGVTTPILHSAVSEPEYKNSFSKLSEGVVLVPSLRQDKGSSFVIEIARLMPNQRFVFVDAQPGEKAKNFPSNCVVLERQNGLDGLYKTASVVLCPSFGILESYGRVSAEAQLRGIPTLVANSGNLSNMVPRESCLEPDVSKWAQRLRELEEPDRYLASVKRSFSKSREFTTVSQLPAELEKLLALAESERYTVGVGSGLGNMVHTTPLISSIARDTSYKVDVLVNSEHGESNFMFSNNDYVRYAVSKHSMLAEALDPERCVLLQCFGRFAPQFISNRKLVRNYSGFEAAKDQHEARYNFNSVHLVDSNLFNQLTTPGPYFIANLRNSRDFTETSRNKLRVGLHAGSKGGHWLSKRWPFYERLAEVLGDYFEFHSFGTPDEFVSGTKDRTGGSIREMSEQIVEMDIFIGNDSGGTHLAYAVGIPTLFLFGPTNSNSRGPSPEHAMRNLLIPKSLCHPCEAKDKKTFMSGKCVCIREIEITEVHAWMKQQEGIV